MQLSKDKLMYYLFYLLFRNFEKSLLFNLFGLDDGEKCSPHIPDTRLLKHTHKHK